jgi:hypothetical protein
LANHTSFSDLVHVFEKQFRQWREKSEVAARSCGAKDGDISFMIGNIRLYHDYARLVVRSFGLQKAKDDNGADLPAAFLEVSWLVCEYHILTQQYQSASMALIATFENELEIPGFTRGCPDFVFTVLTYAAVSLLRVTQPHFAFLEPDRARIIASARKASDILARSAMTPDHLPASQSTFLSRLIEVKSAEIPVTQSQPVYLPEMIDFEAFGQSLEGDQSKTLWPPAPYNFDLSSFPSQAVQPHGRNDPVFSGDTTSMHFDRSEASNTGNGSGDSGNVPTDLSGWVAANQFPMPGLSLGMGSNFGQDDLMFTQDSFWKSIFEGQTQTTGQGQGIGMV